MNRAEAAPWLRRIAPAARPAALLQPHLLWLWPPLLAWLPHLPHLPIWLNALCLALWLWRAALAWHRRPLPRRAVRIVLALVALAAVGLQFGTLIGARAGVPLFILLLFLKLLETETPAQQRLLLILTQFMAMSYFLIGQSLPVALYLMALSMFGVAAMAVATAPAAYPLPRALRLSARLFALGLPLALLLFLFFPRLDQPLWSLPQPAHAARSGLSEHMAPGDIAQLILSGEIAFRASFATPPPAVDGIYWRAIVLTDFDGRTWRAAPDPPAFTGPAQGLGNPWQVRLTLEPHRQRWLLTPGLPDPLPANTRLAGGLQWQAREAVTQRSQWQLRVYPDYRLLEPATARDLALPAGFNPQARALAQSWRQADANPQALVQRALALFRQGFDYTLQPPPLGPHSVDHFLFGTRRGFCEHYASSFVFLMRAAGVPARVVTGYLGGQVNPLDGHIVVRQSEAHAWAEVWLGPATGWQRVDPTASVSPARLADGLTAALPARELPPALTRLSGTWLTGARHTWDMLNNTWNQWVLGYDQTRQLALLARLSPHLATPQWLAQAAILAGALGLALLIGLFWRSGRSPHPDPAHRAWQRVQQRLARAGLAPRRGETPHQHVERVIHSRPELAPALRPLLDHYLHARYRPTADPARLAALQRGANALRIPAPARQAASTPSRH